MRGVRRPADCGRGADAGGDVGLDRPGVAHPQDGAVGQLAGDPQQAGGEGGHEHRDRTVGRHGRVDPEVLALERHRLTGQQGGEHADVLLGVTARVLVGQAVGALDGRLVRRSDAEGEAVAVHGRGHRGGPVGLQHRVAGVGLEHRGAELDRRGGPPGQRHRHQRITAHRAGVPEAGEALRLGPHGLVDHLVHARGAPTQPDSHDGNVPAPRVAAPNSRAPTGADRHDGAMPTSWQPFSWTTPKRSAWSPLYATGTRPAASSGAAAWPRSSPVSSRGPARCASTGSVPMPASSPSE